MTEGGRLAVAVLVSGLVVGVLAEATLRVGPWGLNAALVAAVLLLAVLGLARQHGGPLGTARVGQAAVAAAGAAGLLWRDALVLKALDVACIAGALALLAAERAERRGPRTLTGYFTRVTGSAGHAAVAPALVVVSDVPWGEVTRPSFFLGAMSVVRGLLLAVPVLVVFGGLLGAADAVFARRLAELVDVDLVALLGHAGGAFAWGWAATGLLRAAVLREQPAQRVPGRPEWLTVGRVEVGLVLGLVDVLFAGFVWIQVRYLFGGAAWVQEAAGLSYAEYARTGFFELVTVAALVLGLLLAAHWLLGPGAPGDARLFRVLAGLQVALVLVMLASALFRMRLYQQEYGLTELRFYTTAFMLWLGGLLLWFLATVLLGQREAFARGAVVSAVAVVAALHAIDPDRRIVEWNRRGPHAFDALYAVCRSADAVPALLEAAPRLPLVERRVVAESLLERWSADDDWRVWSVSRARARRQVLEAQAELRGYAGPEVSR